MAHADGPLTGVRVLDFSTMMAGPYGARYLADLGAEVIKVETEAGDFLRSQAPLRDGKSTYFGHLNAGKTSVVLDLKNPADHDKAKKLVATADVLVENFRPGVMRRLGLDYETLAQDNPGLIYCSISGFGQTGEAVERPAYAQIVQASSGYDLANLGYQEQMESPANAVFFFADVLGASYAMGAINAALYHRTVTGRGQMIDLSLMEAMMNMMPYEVQEAQFPAERQRPIYRPVRTSDGFVMIVPNTQRNFEMLMRAIGRDDLTDHPDFATPAKRYPKTAEIFDTVEAWSLLHSSEEAERHLVEAGVPCARYRTVREALGDEQFAHREAFQQVRDPAGNFLVPNLPFKMSGARVAAGEQVPDLGESEPEDLFGR
ncbi:CaiB/BaiF CoA-transferase family protein [Oceanicola sp. 502str15]|uniref:CaiB/BaiF CoA transferase family protein n=1 Tax=Oceanicola sp. 502str15 TaxID=2696061 RepID=UPI002094D5EE|nr:CoA transferase [Oceanicola sp. 502str15]MCO6385290.1 CoA transferase [Oceanicola sp. 502str15]